MDTQRLTKIKESLKDTSLEELQDMSENLTNLIAVLMTRQMAIEDSILDRLKDSILDRLEDSILDRLEDSILDRLEDSMPGK